MPLKMKMDFLKLEKFSIGNKWILKRNFQQKSAVLKYTHAKKQGDGAALKYTHAKKQHVSAALKYSPPGHTT